MGAEVFQLMGKIAIENATAVQNIKDTATEGEKAQTSLNKAFKSIARAATTYLTTKAIEKYMKSVTNLAKSTASNADTIDKMSQKIGVTRKTYQELDYVMSQCGGSVDSMEQGMKTLVSAMSSGNDAFEQLGVSITDSDGGLRDAESVMWDCFTALQGMENQTEKARLATLLFGRSGTSLIPMLNGAEGSIEEMRKQAADLGLIMSDEAVDSGVKFTDALDRANRVIEQIKNKFGEELLPKFTEALDKLTTFLASDSAQAMVSTLAEKFADLANLAFDGLIDLLTWLTGEGNLESLTNVLTVLGATFAAAGIASMVAALNPFSLAIAGIAAGVVAIVTNWNSVKTAIEDAIISLREFLGLSNSGSSTHTSSSGETYGGGVSTIGIIDSGTNYQFTQEYFNSGGYGFANGLDFVSRDRQPAILHYGEAVLNRTDARAWRDGSGTGGIMALADKFDQMLVVMQNGFNQNQQIVLDSGVLVGQTVGMIDSKLGTMAGRKGRGN